MVTWFDTESGQYSQEVYPIDENTAYVEDEEFEYLDEYESSRNLEPAKRLSRGALIGIIVGGVLCCPINAA